MNNCICETDVIEIQQNVPTSIILTLEDESVNPPVPINLTGKTVFISVKELNDFSLDDTKALISSKITVHTTPLSGITTWSLTASETLTQVKRYKADVRIYTGALIYGNSGTFYIDLVPVVTRRLT